MWTWSYQARGGNRLRVGDHNPLCFSPCSKSICLALGIPKKIHILYKFKLFWPSTHHLTHLDLTSYLQTRAALQTPSSSIELFAYWPFSSHRFRKMYKRKLLFRRDGLPKGSHLQNIARLQNAALSTSHWLSRCQVVLIKILLLSFVRNWDLSNWSSRVVNGFPKRLAFKNFFWLLNYLFVIFFN